MYRPSPSPASSPAFQPFPVMQPYGPLSATGFIAPSYSALTVGGNIANSAAAFRSPGVPNIPWTPTYGLQRSWNEAPQQDVADPLCRVLAYPSHCSLSKALTYAPYPDVSSGASLYPFGSSADVQLTDGSPSRLGNPGFFIPVSDFGEEAARTAGHPATHVYGNVTSYGSFMTDPKDGPASYGQTCATRYICANPNPSMTGYESSSADHMNMACPVSYLKTVSDPTLVTLPATPLAVAVANYPDPSPNAFFQYAHPASSSTMPTPLKPARLARLVNEDVLEPVRFSIDGGPFRIVGVSSTAYVPEPTGTVSITRQSNNDTAVMPASSSVSVQCQSLGLRYEEGPHGPSYIATRKGGSSSSSSCSA